MKIPSGTSEISIMLGGHGFDLYPHILPPENLAAVKDCTIPLPVQPQDRSRVDEKYSLRGYRSIDVQAGVNWGENDP